MKLGYPCINWSLGCSPNRTFRLASYSEERFLETVAHNLSCLKRTLKWNLANGFLFFRISSDTIPFASHPVNTCQWLEKFQSELRDIGAFINENHFRISMHPDQYVLINTPQDKILERSVADLKWHAAFLDAMGLDATAKIQIHVGGVYGDKPAALKRFIENYQGLSNEIKRRLVIENDDRLFNLKDCLAIFEHTAIPVLFDNFHHACLNNGESNKRAMRMASVTWREQDGVPMVDFSHQQPGARLGKHTDTIDLKQFQGFVDDARGLDFDIMLEIKDKEKSAQKALPLLR